MRVEARVKAQQLAAARALDASGFAKSQGASSTGAMLAGSFGGDRRAGDQMVFMGKALQGASRTEEALARGEIGQSQAAIIATAIADLPDDTTSEEKQACEDTLIGDAGRFNLKDLRSTGRSGSPTSSNPSPKSTRSRTRAWSGRRRTPGGGPSSGWSTTVTAPTAVASSSRTPKQTCSAPRSKPSARPAATTSTTTPPPPSPTTTKTWTHRHRLGMGFAELCGHLPADKLPGKGGLGATLMVRFDYDTLIHGHQTRHLVHRHPHLSRTSPPDGLPARDHPPSL